MTRSRRKSKRALSSSPSSSSNKRSKASRSSSSSSSSSGSDEGGQPPKLCPHQLAIDACRAKRYETAMIFADSALRKRLPKAERTHKVLSIYSLPPVTNRNEPNYYQVLGLDQDASIADIETAFRRVQFLVHPRQNPGLTISRKVLTVVNQAKDTLLWWRLEYNNRLPPPPPPPQNLNNNLAPLSSSSTTSSSSSDDGNPPVPAGALWRI